MLIDEFGFDPHGAADRGFDAGRFEQRGIALLPYVVAGSRADRARGPDRCPSVDRRGRASASYLAAARTTDGTDHARGRIMALAGLAGLGEDVLAELRAIARPMT